MEVPFFDVDSFRVVWHGNYPKYFEVGRCQLLEDIGYPYEKMESEETFFPIVDLRVKYVSTIVFKQQIRVQSILKQWQNKLQIDYRIFDVASGNILTKAQTSQVAVTMPGHVLQYQTPATLIEAVDQWRLQRQS